MAEASWLIAPGPVQLDPLTALARIADAAAIVCLHGGPGGWVYLCWLPMHAEAPPIEHRGAGALAAVTAAASALGAPTPAHPEPPGAGWGGDFTGGFFVQLDYEWPAVPLAALPAPFVVRWDPAGQCSICVADAALLPGILSDLAGPERRVALPRLRGPLLPTWDAQGHRTRITALQASIADGAIYQANLTLAFSAPIDADAAADVGLFCSGQPSTLCGAHAVAGQAQHRQP